MTPANVVELFGLLREFISEGALDIRYRRHASDFTRRRLLPFGHVVALILSALKRTLGVELQSAFDLLECPVCPTASALSQARGKLAPEFFKDWLERLTELAYGYGHHTLNGFRLIAVDGSMVFLPDSPGVRAAFPPVSNNGDPMQARFMCWHDVLNDHAIAARLEPSSRTEIDMAFEGLEGFGGRDILIYDRSFPGWGLFHFHQLKGVPFVARCKVSFNKEVKAFLESGALEAVVELKAPRESVDRLKGAGVAVKVGDTLSVRLLRVDIGAAEPEVLATSLLDAGQFPHAAFKELYARRWKVETFFDRIKNKFQLEIFSGRTERSVRQDFHAAIFLANLQSIITRAIDPQVRQAASQRKHPCQVNCNKTLGLLKPGILLALLGHHPATVLKKLMTQMALPRNLEPVRKGRKTPRSGKRKRLRTKHCHYLNFKRAI